LLVTKFSVTLEDFELKTLLLLFTLLVITNSVEKSNFFVKISKILLKYIKNEKTLFYFFTLFTIFLSAFLTNDIALFIVIPLTLTIKRYIHNDLTKLIIFEAISANIGSTLTPFGNPQNLYIFYHYNLDFFEFLKISSHPFLIELLVLLVFVQFIPKKDLQIKEKIEINVDYKNFTVAIVSFFIFFVGLEIKNIFLMALPILFLFFISKENLKIDYMLIITFAFMFADFNILSKHITLELTSFTQTLNYTILISQIISNVPATILISHHTNFYDALIIGSNIAGNGLFIASLANIIALRFINGYFIFHTYSIPFFIVSYILIFLV